MVESKEVDEVMEKIDDEVLTKEVTQLEKVVPATRALTDMGIFYKEITKKLVDDGVCFICKKEIKDDEPFDIIKVPNHKIDKGMVAYIMSCKECNKDE